MVNSVTADLLLQIVQCWNACAVDEEKLALHIVLYCSGIMYKYYSRNLFFPIKHNEEGKYIYNEILNNIPHFIIIKPLRIDFLQDGFVMYSNKVILCKREVIPPIPD